MAENGTTETTTLTDKQLQVLPYLVASPSMSEGVKKPPSYNTNW